MVEKMAILINLNDARKKLYELEGSTEYNKGVTDAFNALFDLPTVEAEPIKHGRWIYPNDETYPPYCSECKQDAIDYIESNYCPNCGARMDEVEE